MAGGRPKGNVRDFLKDGGKPDSEGKTWCGMLGCNFSLMAKAGLPTSKWAEHLVLKCKFASSEVRAKVAKTHQTDNIKLKYEEEAPSWQKNPPTASTPAPEMTASGRAGVGGSRKADEMDGGSVGGAPPKKAKMDDYTDKCNPGRATRITEAITKFIVGCALPFLIVESVFFISMINELNGAYVKHLPKVDAFRTKWMPELFDDTVKKLAIMWRELGDPLLTLGFDGFKTEADTHVVNCTETAGDKTAFKSCVEPNETEREDGAFYARLIEKELKDGAAARGKSVEDTYAGVVADNVVYNRVAFETVHSIYPFLFLFGCIAHCFDLLCEDLAGKVE
jgi:hypothetical protein